MEKITQANINRLKHLSWHSSEPVAVVKLVKENTNYFITDYHSDHSVTAFVDSPNGAIFENIPIDTLEQDKAITRDLMFKETSIKELNIIEPSGLEQMLNEMYEKHKSNEIHEDLQQTNEYLTDKELEEFNQDLPDFDIDR